MKEIDSLVSLINQRQLGIKRDTIKQYHPELGLSIRTYLTMVTDSSGLRKYVNNAHMKRQENGITTETITTSSFYFERKKLIKVEESGTSGEKKMEASWYYADDKPIHYTMQNEKGRERAALLLTLGNAMVLKTDQD